MAHSQPTAPTESQWHLFNDFLVRPVKDNEAVTFNTSWKIPSIITYQAKGGNNRIDNSWKTNLDTSLLYLDHKYVRDVPASDVTMLIATVAKIQERKLTRHLKQPLRRHEQVR